MIGVLLVGELVIPRHLIPLLALAILYVARNPSPAFLALGKNSEDRFQTSPEESPLVIHVSYHKGKRFVELIYGLRVLFILCLQNISRGLDADAEIKPGTIVTLARVGLCILANIEMESVLFVMNLLTVGQIARIELT